MALKYLFNHQVRRIQLKKLDFAQFNKMELATFYFVTKKTQAIVYKNTIFNLINGFNNVSLTLATVFLRAYAGISRVFRLHIQLRPFTSLATDILMFVTTRKKVNGIKDAVST